MLVQDRKLLNFEWTHRLLSYSDHRDDFKEAKIKNKTIFWNCWEELSGATHGKGNQLHEFIIGKFLKQTEKSSNNSNSQGKYQNLDLL